MLALLAGAAWVAPGACEAPMTYRWADETRQFRVQSDFPRMAFDGALAPHLHQILEQLDGLFGRLDLSSLLVVVHDAPAGGLGGARQGEQTGQRIDLWAGWFLPEGEQGLGLPRFDEELTTHELVHFYLHGNGQAVPRWLEEGLANVIGEALIDEQGAWHLMRSAANERLARRALRNGSAFGPKELFSYRDGYPEQERWSVFYAECTSLARFLVESQAGELGERIRAVLALDPAEREAAFAAWRGELESEPLNLWFTRQVASGGPAVRHRVAHELEFLERNVLWLGLAATLLDDDEPSVRSSARIWCVYFAPGADRAPFVIQARWFADRHEPRVHFAGLAGLAQTGDLPAALKLLDAVADGTLGADWEQALLWFSLRLRGEPEEYEVPDFRPAERALADWAGGLAAWIRVQRQILHWDGTGYLLGDELRPASTPR